MVVTAQFKVTVPSFPTLSLSILALAKSDLRALSACCFCLFACFAMDEAHLKYKWWDRDGIDDLDEAVVAVSTRC